MDKAAVFVQRRRLAVTGHDRIVRWLLNKLFSMALRDVALRAIGLTGASLECCRQSRSFCASTTFGGNGP